MDLEDLSKHEKSGYLGSLLLIVGPFLSVACVFGTCFDYIGDGRDGIFILGFGLISAYLVKKGKFKGLAVTGGLSLLISLEFWLDIMDTPLVEVGVGLWMILAGSVLVCYTSWSAWDLRIRQLEEKLQSYPSQIPPPPTSSPSISHPPEIIPVAEPETTIECPGCAAQMKVPRLGKMQNITCDSCGMSGEINI